MNPKAILRNASRVSLSKPLLPVPTNLSRIPMSIKPYPRDSRNLGKGKKRLSMNPAYIEGIQGRLAFVLLNNEL